MTAVDSLGVSLDETRLAQREWAARPVSTRMEILRAWRYLIAEHSEALAAATAAVSARPVSEKLVSEVLPLADGYRWLEKNAGRVLASEKIGRQGRPFWLRGIRSEIQRKPYGIILVVGPGNYPLFLPSIHAVQALAAGNAVWVKPAPGTRGVMERWAALAREAGLPGALLAILPDTLDAARQALRARPDKVIFTGSSENGRAVLAELAMTGTPSVMELSGRDCVLVLSGADLELVVRALRFAARLNGGQTCMAPRRLIAVEEVADELRRLLSSETGVVPPMEIVRDAEEAITRANSEEHGLGASIFTRNLQMARHVAAHLNTGFATINDVIVPTADPRLPFGGVKASGFGVTRGAAGLLEMTFPHVVTERSGRHYEHLDEPRANDTRLFAAYMAWAHGRRPWAGLRALVGAIFARRKVHPPSTS